MTHVLLIGNGAREHAIAEAIHALGTEPPPLFLHENEQPRHRLSFGGGPPRPVR